MLFKKRKPILLHILYIFRTIEQKKKSLLFFVTEVQQFVVFNAIPSNNWRQIILEVINISLPLSHRFTGQEKSDLEKPRNHSCCLSPIWQKMHFFPSPGANLTFYCLYFILSHSLSALQTHSLLVYPMPVVSRLSPAGHLVRQWDIPLRTGFWKVMNWILLPNSSLSWLGAW